MIFTKILLIVHLLGASYIGILTIATLFSLIKRKLSIYLPLAKHVAVTGCLQLVSGSLLALSIRNGESIFTFCSKIGFYLGLVAVLEILLFKAMHEEKQIQFPLRFVSQALSLGIAVATVAAFSL